MKLYALILIIFLLPPIAFADVYADPCEGLDQSTCNVSLLNDSTLGMQSNLAKMLRCKTTFGFFEAMGLDNFKDAYSKDKGEGGLNDLVADFLTVSYSNSASPEKKREMFDKVKARYDQVNRTGSTERQNIPRPDSSNTRLMDKSARSGSGGQGNSQQFFYNTTESATNSEDKNFQIVSDSSAQSELASGDPSSIPPASTKGGVINPSVTRGLRDIFTESVSSRAESPDESQGSSSLLTGLTRRIQKARRIARKIEYSASEELGRISPSVNWDDYDLVSRYSKSEEVKNMTELAKARTNGDSAGVCYKAVKWLICKPSQVTGTYNKRSPSVTGTGECEPNSIMYGLSAPSGRLAKGAINDLTVGLRAGPFTNLLDDPQFGSKIKGPADAPKGSILVYDKKLDSKGKPLRYCTASTAGHIEIRTEDPPKGGYVSDYQSRFPISIFPQKREDECYKLIGVMIAPRVPRR